MTHPGYRIDRIAIISESSSCFLTPIMAASLLNWLSLQGATIALLCLLLAIEVVGEDGICTRSEEVLKSKPQTYYETDMEMYTDKCRRGRKKFTCFKSKVVGRYVTKEQSYTELETKHFCCPGYFVQQESPLSCSPVCDFTCSNGKCTRPNYCECDSGYIKKTETENICEPVCNEECIHGYCSKPEYCECHFGYDYNPSISSSLYVCSPVCSNSCINANCIAPDVCSCLAGFAKTLTEPNKCHPVCSLPCHNGVCSSPEECTCFKGYRTNSSWNVCDPVCSNKCINAKCTGPEECTCLDRFTKVANVCEPLCTVGCMNGKCIEPETCSCLSGYKSSSDPFACIPVCLPECVNGNCTNPDQCECFPGFEEAGNNVCRPYCSDCENGVCSEPEVCSCFWGFEKTNLTNCSRQEEKNIDCTFSKTIFSHEFDKHCFKLNRSISLNLDDCEILQYLTAINENSTVLGLHCKNTSTLKLLNSTFQLNLECTVKLQKVEDAYNENTLTSDDFSSTFAYSDFPDLESTTQFTSETTSDQYTETYEVESTVENIKNDQEFHIKSDVILSETTKFSNLLLDLKVTLEFLSLIKNSTIMKNHFDTVHPSERDWCLCNHNQKNWTICASQTVQLFVCPCQPSHLKIVIEEPTTFLPLRTTTTLVLIFMAGLLVVYVVYTSKNICWSYITKGPISDAETSRPVAVDLVYLDESPEDESC